MERERAELPPRTIRLLRCHSRRSLRHHKLLATTGKSRAFSEAVAYLGRKALRHHRSASHGRRHAQSRWTRHVSRYLYNSKVLSQQNTAQTTFHCRYLLPVQISSRTKISSLPTPHGAQKSAALFIQAETCSQTPVQHCEHPHDHCCISTDDLHMIERAANGTGQIFCLR